MNELISRMVNALFEDVADTEETRAMHDEIMNNCQEHYQDLVNSGMNEKDAVHAVMESLNGMQDVISQYPKKAEMPAPAAEEEEEETEAPEEEKRLDAEGIERILVNAGAFDVEVTGSDDSTIRIWSDQMDRIETNREGGILTVKSIPRAVKVTEEVLEDVQEEQETRGILDMSLNEIFRKVRKTVESAVNHATEAIRNMSEGGRLEISVPRDLLPALEVNTSSGDVRVNETRSAEVTLRTASGDVELDGEVKDAIDRLFVSAASGDIRVHTVWAKEAEISSISGDVELDGDFGTLNAKSVSGDVEFEGTAENLNSKSVSGDVELNMVRADAGNISAEATSGDVEVVLPVNSAEARVECGSTVGEISCEVPDAGEDAPLRIRARTVSGDITVRKEE